MPGVLAAPSRVGLKPWDPAAGCRGALLESRQHRLVPGGFLCWAHPATEGRICSFWGSTAFLHPPPFFQKTDSRSNPRLPPDYTTAGTKPRYLPTLPTSPPAAGAMPRPWQPLVLPTCPARSSSSLVLSSPSPEHG